jgi:polyphosphate kinase
VSDGMGTEVRIPETEGTTTEGAVSSPERSLSDPALYVNRELSQLRFFERVLEEAQDPRVPLLERVKFLAILGSIMSEFFMVRVAGLKQQIDAHVVETAADGMTPKEQVTAIRPLIIELMSGARACFREVLIGLREAGIHITDYEDLTPAQKQVARTYFEEIVFPVLTPLAYDPGRPFPFISNMSLNLAVVVKDEDGAERFARVKVPDTLPRLIPVDVPAGESGKGGAPPDDLYLVWLEQVVAAYLAELFPGLEIVEAHPFRVTRDADIAIQELEAGDLLDLVERSVRLRRFGSVVRLVIDKAMPAQIRALLARNLEIEPEDIYAVDLPLAMSNLGDIYGLDRPELKDPSFLAATPAGLEQAHDTQIFAAIRRRDILLHHPYDSFDPVVQFLETAAHDPDVLAIKITLYRVGRNSPVVSALLDAAGNGKQVAVLLELKARFDEESNIEWARRLENEGVHVVYGVPKLKTHCKIALVVRREGPRIRRYVHLATGNYNVVTAAQYDDLGLFTCADDFGEDASDLFNFMTGYSLKRDYQKLAVAPFGLRGKMETLIRREMDHQRAGGHGHLIFKINSLVDKKMIQLLYAASQAGVEIELLVRGICCLRPEIVGVSENIRVTSIVGRFLEHSRIYWFSNGGAEECYLSSADLMPRNLDRRVELLFPVEDPRLVRKLRYEILSTYLADNVKARRLHSDCGYERVQPVAGDEALNSQEWFIAKRLQGMDDAAAEAQDQGEPS